MVNAIVQANLIKALDSLGEEERLQFLCFMLAREIDTQFSDREDTLSELTGDIRQLWREHDRSNNQPVSRIGFH